MQQSMDLIKKIQQRRAVVAVMMNGRFLCFGDSGLGGKSRVCAKSRTSLASRSIVPFAQTVAYMQHLSLVAEPGIAAVVDSSAPAGVVQCKALLLSINVQSAYLCSGGVSNVGYNYAACTITTKEFEQRCCEVA